MRNSEQKLDFENLKVVTEVCAYFKKRHRRNIGCWVSLTNSLSIQEESIIRLAVISHGDGRWIKSTLNSYSSELRFYSEHDPPTGLHNHVMYSHDLLDYEIDRSARHNHEFSVLMI